MKVSRGLEPHLAPHTSQSSLMSMMSFGCTQPQTSMQTSSKLYDTFNVPTTNSRLNRIPLPSTHELNESNLILISRNSTYPNVKPISQHHALKISS
jgi:hypothetical protein